MVVAAFRSVGVKEAKYTDRYLTSPLCAALLASLLAATPGRAKTSPRQILMAPSQSMSPDRMFLYDDFGDDRLRAAVVEALIPSVRLQNLPRRDLPQARTLQLTLGDRRRVSILLDQGSGAWRCAPHRHNFLQDPQTQARTLRHANFDVTICEPNGTPVVVEFSS